MTILSDASIRARCVPPATTFDLKYYGELIEERNRLGWPLTDYAVDAIRSELMAKATRPLTEEEIASFVPMIAPFDERLIRQVAVGENYLALSPEGRDVRKIISRGLSSCGYDVSLADDEIKIFSNVNAGEIDPKELDPNILMDAKVRECPKKGRYFLLPPNSYALVRTVEYFHMPRDVVAICLGKSTYARAGIAINATPIEPGWHGNVVIEIANQTTIPARVYLEEGISQFLFLQLDSPCETSYDDRGGKYQGQTGVTLSKV